MSKILYITVKKYLYCSKCQLILTTLNRIKYWLSIAYVIHKNKSTIFGVLRNTDVNPMNIVLVML